MPANASSGRIVIQVSSHALGRVDPDQVEAPRDHRLRGPAEPEAKRLLVAAENTAVVVEAVEIVGEPDRVDRDRVWRTPFRCLCDERRELGDPLEELALAAHRHVGERSRGLPRSVAQDPGDPRVGVLDVVDRVLLASLTGEVDVDLDRSGRDLG